MNELVPERKKRKTEANSTIQNGFMINNRIFFVFLVGSLRASVLSEAILFYEVEKNDSWQIAFSSSPASMCQHPCVALMALKLTKKSFLKKNAFFLSY